MSISNVSTYSSALTTGAIVLGSMALGSAVTLLVLMGHAHVLGIAAAALGVSGVAFAAFGLYRAVASSPPSITKKPLGMVNRGNDCWFLSDLQFLRKDRSFREKIETLPQYASLRAFYQKYESSMTDLKAGAIEFPQAVRDLIKPPPMALPPQRGWSALGWNLFGYSSSPDPQPVSIAKPSTPFVTDFGSIPDTGQQQDAAQGLTALGASSSVDVQKTYIFQKVIQGTPRTLADDLQIQEKLDLDSSMIELAMDDQSKDLQAMLASHFSYAEKNKDIRANLTDPKASLVQGKFFNAPAILVKTDTAFIAEPPSVTIHLKRFTNSRQKISTPIQVPDEVTIPRVKKQSRKYRLDAFIVHAGSSAQSGHYYTCVKEDDHWFKINDDSVTVLPKEALAKEKSQAYLLLYS